MSKLVCAIAAILLPLGTSGHAATTTKPPHIIFIVADDLGWHDVGFRNGNEIRTPNIDGFAKDGVILDQYYVQSVCSPTRATFMTGRYPIHHTVNDWLVSGTATALPLNETMIPQKLVSDAGYRAHATGKWHLGFTTWRHTPTFRGFESFVGFYSGGEAYFAHEATGAYDFRRDQQPKCGANCSQVNFEDKDTYSTHVFTAEAVKVIQNHDPSKAPLFLYLAYQAVHAPSQAPDSYIDAYSETIANKHRRVFAGMLSCMDEGIGNVTAALKAKGMLEESLIVFTTDNGGPQWDTPGGDYVGSINYPLRGGKHSIWEGGTRGTAVVWAGPQTDLLPSTRRGTTMKQLMHAADWFPTFCSVANILESCTQLPLDGVDQSGPLFQGSESKRTEVFYGAHDNAPEMAKPYDTALRDLKGWKLLQKWGGLPMTWSQPSNASSLSLGVAESMTWSQPSNSSNLSLGVAESEAAAIASVVALGYYRSLALGAADNASAFDATLYYLPEDPGEHHDVSGKNPEIVRTMQARIDAVRATAVDVVGGGTHPDPSCPKYDQSKFVDPHVGNVWSPWCDQENDFGAALANLPSFLFQTVV